MTGLERIISAVLASTLGIILWTALPISTMAEDNKTAPQAIVIPSIGTYSSLISLGLNPDHTLEVPSLDHPQQAGWYSFGTAPGSDGPAIIAGHVDGHGQLGVFANLTKVHPGDDIMILRRAQDPLVFSVDHIEKVPKDTFPTNSVYGPTSDPELRLITCTGHAVFGLGYDSNLIVYAKLKR